MGFRLTTIHITGRDRDSILKGLGLQLSGAAWSDPPSESVCCRACADGAYLIVAMDDMGRHAEPGLLRALSANAQLLVCQIHEGCMWSQIGGWRNGKQVWSVEHVSEEGLTHLDVVGTPPAPFVAIRQVRETRQAAETRGPFGVDHFFDIAPALYAELTGYRYDRLDPSAVFETLIPSSLTTETPPTSAVP